MVSPISVVRVTCGRRYLSTAVDLSGFLGFLPMVQREFFAVLQHRARELGPVEELVWTAEPDLNYKPPKPEQLGLF